jgi:hypothetical protein
VVHNASEEILGHLESRVIFGIGWNVRLRTALFLTVSSFQMSFKLCLADGIGPGFRAGRDLLA